MSTVSLAPFSGDKTVPLGMHQTCEKARVIFTCSLFASLPLCCKNQSLKFVFIRQSMFHILHVEHTKQEKWALVSYIPLGVGVVDQGEGEGSSTDDALLDMGHLASMCLRGAQPRPTVLAWIPHRQRRGFEDRECDGPAVHRDARHTCPACNQG